MEWFRMYHEARNDRKLATLNDAEHRVWFDLMCLASDRKENRGIVSGYTPDLLALEVAHGDVSLLDQTIDKLKALHILRPDDEDLGALIFINWGKRQYDKPSDQPEAVRERVAKSRETRRNAISNEEALQGVTERYGAIRNDQNRTDTEQIQNRADQIAPTASARVAKTVSQEMWDALIDAGYPTPVTKSERDRRNGGIKQLVDAGVQTTELKTLRDEYIKRFPGVAVTLHGLLNHIAELRKPSVNGSGHHANGYRRPSVNDNLMRTVAPVEDVPINPEWEAEWKQQEKNEREATRAKAHWSTVKSGETPTSNRSSVT